MTEIAGAAMGDMILARMPFVSAMARGAMFGVAAYGAGTARPSDRRDRGRELGVGNGTGRRDERSSDTGYTIGALGGAGGFVAQRS